MLNKRGTRYRVTFGEPIAPERLEGEPEAVTQRLQAHVESRFDAPFA